MAREDFQSVVTRKDLLIAEEQRKNAETREMCDAKVLDLKTSFLDLQTENNGLKETLSLLRSQLSQLQKERDRSNEQVFQKDATIDKLKGEIVVMTRAFSQKKEPEDRAEREYEQRSAQEFSRLRGLTEQLKDCQVEIERLKMESLVKDKEYLKLKEKAEAALDEKNETLRQIDLVNFENQKLKDEQDVFLKELGEVRDLYESQIDALTTKLRKAAEEAVRSKAKAAELTQENNFLKMRIDEGKKRVAARDLELEKMTSDKVFEMGGMFKVKPTDFLASPSMLKVSLENESMVASPSPEGKEDFRRVLNTLHVTEVPDARRDFLHEDKMKLEWDSLLHRIGSIGTK